MKSLCFIAAFLLLTVLPAAFAKDKENSRQVLVIPVTGSGQSTTSPLGASHTTRTSSGQSFSTSQLGSTTITRDNSGNTWRTTKVGNSFVTQGPNGQTQTTTKLVPDPLKHRRRLVHQSSWKQFHHPRNHFRKGFQTRSDCHSKSQVTLSLEESGLLLN
jgi:hypothetical protein